MKGYIFAILAAGAFVLSQVAEPHSDKTMRNDSAGIDLNALAPKTVGEWHVVNKVPDVMRQMKNRDGVAAAIYDGVLMKTYRRRSDGAVLWLVIAHGADQRGGLVLHMPEMCYRSLGYSVEPVGLGSLKFDGYVGEIKRVLARSNNRVEPISYWVVMDNQVITRRFGQSIRQLWYGLTGASKSGTLIRVSMPMRMGSVETAYRRQKEFISDLLKAWPAGKRGLIWPISANGKDVYIYNVSAKHVY